MNQETNEWQAFIRKANQLFRATIHPAAAALPIEGEMPPLGGATEWLNSKPLTAAGLRGNIVLNVVEDGRPGQIPVKEGEIVLLPGHYRHSPQRPEPGSVGLVVEKIRPRDVDDAFEWYCPECWARIHRVEVNVQDIVKDLPPLFDAFYRSDRKCPSCGHIHPGKG